MKITRYDQLRHGMRVRCIIGGRQINDARISISEDDREENYAYICQNYISGDNGAEYDFGYCYSWIIFGNSENWDSIEEIESIEGNTGDFEWEGETLEELHQQLTGRKK